MSSSIPGPLAVPGDQRLIVPAYFYPSNNRWQELCDRLYRQLTSAVLVMNPSSGPGNARDDNYRSAVEYARTRRQRVIGYVTTRNPANEIRPLAEVSAEIDRYYTFYPGIGGVFFDEMSNNPGNKAKYQAFYTWAKGKSPTALVVGNPGIPATHGGPENDGAWQVTSPAVADVVVVFEGPWARSPGDAATLPEYRTWSAPAWVFSRPAATFAHLVYESPDDTTTRSICTTSSRRNAGWIYVTRDRRPNPWDTPPSDALTMSPTLRRRQVAALE